MNKTIIKIEGIAKTFDLGEEKVKALKPVSFEVKEKDFIIVYGPSGCGKTTLLNILIGIDQPTRGKIYYDEIDFFSLEEDDRAHFRLKNIGMVYQMSYWIKSLNVLENISLPLILKKRKEYRAKSAAEEIIYELGLTDFANKQPYQLSSGEQQKIGLARALITDPKIIIADEPTGNLDSDSSKKIMDMLKTLNTKYGKTILMVTHDDSYRKFGNRIIEMKDGEIVKDG